VKCKFKKFYRKPINIQFFKGKQLKSRLSWTSTVTLTTNWVEGWRSALSGLFPPPARRTVRADFPHTALPTNFCEMVYVA
jgi:hypothetical protein